MNAYQLQCAINCDPKMKKNHISGVFAANEIPHIIHGSKNGFIANTDPKHRSGQHWIAFYLNGKGILECFDSYGNSPEKYSPYFKQFMTVYSRIEINSKRLQSKDTIVCGQHYLFYLMCRTRGYSLYQLTDLFNEYFNLNDQFVYNVIDEQLYCCMSICRNNYQVCLCEK